MKIRLLSEGCNGGTCPTIYETDRETYIVQGIVMDEESRALVKPGAGEDAVEIPKDLLLAILKKVG